MIASAEYVALLGAKNREERLQRLMRAFSDAPKDVVVVSLTWNFRTETYTIVLESQEYKQKMGDELTMVCPTFVRNELTEPRWNAMQRSWEEEDQVGTDGS